jgi:hypothetical protein
VILLSQPPHGDRPTTLELVALVIVCAAFTALLYFATH